MSMTAPRVFRVSFVFVSLSLTALAGAVPEFSALPAIDHPVGEETGVQTLALGDVDGDAVLDLAAIGADTEEVTLFLGDGDGSFAPGAFVGLADLPSAIGIADLTSPFDTGGDVDGLADVIVADEIGGLQIFIGRGDGTFDEPDQSFDDLDTVEISGFAVADFDGDGRGDLALLESFDGVYFLCNDSGTLVACPTSVVFLDEFSFELVDIDVGDLDGDGDLDVAVVDVDSGELYVIHGNGDGTFDELVEPIAIAEGGLEPRALRVADLGGDDRDDIAVLLADTLNDGASSVAVLVSTGGEERFARTDYPAGEWGRALALADFDEDGALDAVVVGTDDLEGTSPAVYLPGLAEGGFAAPDATGLAAIAGGRAVESADLDGSGSADLVAVVDFGSEIQVMLNGAPPVCAGDCNRNGSVAINELITAVNIALGNTAIDACAAADGNGNGEVAINELVAAVNRALNGCG